MAPLHFEVVSTGAPRRSASAVSCADAPSQKTPSPTRMMGLRALANMSSGAFRLARSGSGSRRFGIREPPSASPASRVVSLCGKSNWTGPGGLPVASRIARRTCWRTVLALMVVPHFTSGA
jgi:hypothetical protein